MSLAQRYGILNASRDPKLKLPEIPAKPAGQSDSALAARVAKLEAELAALRETVRGLTPITRNVVTPVTDNATVTRNANAERQRAYRERMKAKASNMRDE
jgi:hypothetical protein